MSTQKSPLPSKVNEFASKLMKALRDIQEEEAVPKREVDINAGVEDKKRHDIDKTPSVHRSVVIYRLLILVLQSIVDSLDLKREIRPEELEAVLDKFSTEEVIRLQAITCQFCTDPALVKPPEDLSWFMFEPAAESMDRIRSLEGARTSWIVMTGHGETGREFVYKADKIRDKAIQLIRDLDKSNGCKAQSMPLPLQRTPKADEPSVSQSMQIYQGFPEEVECRKQVAIAKHEATAESHTQWSHKECNCQWNCSNNHSLELSR
ncbi:hypothetical protein TEQG_01414 [Trichophyton equinum CBS 127.97]|uniref:Uncharacterized protein n=1 Tax=Trichophyton equinum (strain ATCC MYA-4606 / CBS 127.97) TaxID=559882 RepID=F2PKF9_TRIEC|nr:hypothetical protein TEQG_01414 [Trichophyton equinum CBS 127.97]